MAPVVVSYVSGAVLYESWSNPVSQPLFCFWRHVSPVISCDCRPWKLWRHWPPRKSSCRHLGKRFPWAQFVRGRSEVKAGAILWKLGYTSCKRRVPWTSLTCSMHSCSALEKLANFQLELCKVPLPPRVEFPISVSDIRDLLSPKHYLCGIHPTKLTTSVGFPLPVSRKEFHRRHLDHLDWGLGEIFERDWKPSLVLRREWGNGMMVDSHDRWFPHSLLSTSTPVRSRKWLSVAIKTYQPRLFRNCGCHRCHFHWQDQIIALESEVLDDCIALRSLPNDEAEAVCSYALDAASNLYLHSTMSSFRFVKVCSFTINSRCFQRSHNSQLDVS